MLCQLGQDLTHLAYKEITQSDIFLWDRWKFFLLHFVHLGLWYNFPSPMDKILTLWNPHKLLKNLGALSEYAINAAKVPPKTNWNPYCLSWIRCNGQKSISCHFPFKGKMFYNEASIEQNYILLSPITRDNTREKKSWNNVSKIWMCKMGREGKVNEKKEMNKSEKREKSRSRSTRFAESREGSRTI